MSGRILTVVKTHYWDDAVAYTVDANRCAVGDAEFVVLYDTTRSEEPQIERPQVVHHSEKDYFLIGLYRNDHHRPLLWYNGDYTLYYARRLFPNFSHYVICEYDCHIRSDIAPELRKLAMDNVDFAAAQFGRRSADWSWFSSLGELPAEKYGCNFPFLFASSRAIDALLVERLRMSARASIAAPSVWPFCEGFVPTVLKADETMKVRPLEDYFNLAFFRVQPSFDPATAFPESIKLVHPLLDDRADRRKRSELESLIRAYRSSKPG